MPSDTFVVDPSGTFRPSVFWLPATRLSGAVSLSSRRIARRSEPSEEEALPGAAGCQRAARCGMTGRPLRTSVPRSCLLVRLAGTLSCSWSIGAGALAASCCCWWCGRGFWYRTACQVRKGQSGVLPLGVFQLESVSQYNFIGESETGTLKAIKCL